MSDLIDRTSLAEHKFPGNECNGLGEGHAYRQGWNDAIDAIIDNAPSAEPEQHWIPVTERLPNHKQIVLITNRKGNVRCGQYRGIDFVINGRQCWQWKGNTSEQVVAWMPMPEPWKGEEDEWTEDD